MKQGTANLAEDYCFIHKALRQVNKAWRQIAAVPPSNSRPVILVDDRCNLPIFYVLRNNGDIDDREWYVEHVVFAVLREISSELYYRSTPHHDAVREKYTSWTDR